MMQTILGLRVLAANPLQSGFVPKGTRIGTSPNRCNRRFIIQVRLDHFQNGIINFMVYRLI